MNLNKSLSDVEKILSEHKSLKDYIDETGQIFVLASTLLSLLIAPNPVSAIAAFGLGTDIFSFRFSRLLDWLPEKLNYFKKGKEEVVVQRYEKATLVNMMIFHIAIQTGVKKVIPNYAKSYNKAIKKLHESEDPEEQKENYRKHKQKLTEEGQRLDRKIRNHSLEFNENFRNCISSYIRNICLPFISELVDKAAMVDQVDPSKRKQEKEEILKKLEQEIYLNYNACLVHLTVEFPEFSMWVDLSQKENIIKNQKKILNQLKDSKSKVFDIEKLQEKFNGEVIGIQTSFIKKLEGTIKELEKLKDFSFEKSYGFEKLIENQDFALRKLDDLSILYEEEKLANIEAHHNQIKHKLEERLVDNEDIEGIVYPKNHEIFVPQSFKSISYQRAKHQKQFLLDNFWSTSESFKGENVGKFIMNELSSPENSFKPIIILGNPGAGKSMLSSILAARLCDSNDFVPFFIRLREVVLSDTNPKNHINEGIEKTIEGNVDVDWISWAKEFKNRIPVIVLDGFDELLRASQAEISNYITRIKTLLENVYRDYGIAARIILTSRLTVMQDVEIPNETTIIRLDSFDEKRQNQWIEQWNSFQTKSDFKKFELPENNSVKELAKEPLLLFMLAVYDFENSDLQNDANQQDFSQSKLYDKLFEKFTIRQLDKDQKYGELSPIKKKKLRKKFRLRLGAISTLMFLNDIDFKETQKLKEELDSFGIGGEDAQPNLIFKGFFFIHKDKSTGMTGQQIYTFEFVHKSFGEFLTADFILRVLLERFEHEDAIEKLQRDDSLRFCWGYNWLHKHYNTTRFLFEHANQLIPKDSPIKPFTIGLIKSELKNIFGTKINLFPISDLSLINSKPVLEHLSIYSQNLILAWGALEKNNPFLFNLFGIDEIPKNEFKFENQDRTEVDKNKIYWKRIVKLWELYGSRNTVAKLREWVGISEEVDGIRIKFKNNEIKHNFSDSTQISCNDYELLLSYSDYPRSIKTLKSIIKKKKELLPVGVKILNDKYDYFFREDEDYLFELSIEFVKQGEISTAELVRLIENIHQYFPLFNTNHLFREHLKDGRIRDIQSQILFNSTGNSPYWVFQDIDRTREDLVERFPIKEFERMGLNRSLKFLENFSKFSFRGIKNKYLSKLLDSKVNQFLGTANDIQLANYLSYFYKIPKKIRYKEPIIEPELVKYVFRKSFEKLESKSRNPIFLFKYLKSFILTKVYLGTNISNRSKYDNDYILPNEIIERIYYGMKLPFREFENRDFHQYVDYLELFIIALKNRNIEIQRDFNSIESFCQIGLDYFRKDKGRRYNPHWHIPKFFELLTILSEDKKSEKEYRYILLKFIEIYWEQYSEKNRSFSYQDHLKLLKVMSDFQEEIHPRLFEKCVDSLYESSNKLRNFNRKMRLQFALILYNSDSKDNNPNWHIISDILRNPKMRNSGERLVDNLNFLQNYYYEILHEFKNDFYYEVNRADNFPYYFLRRSILHGDEEQFR